MALLIVMGVAAVAGVMAAHLMTISEVVAMEAKVAAVRTDLRYAAESVADRAFWFYMTDRRLYPDRTLGRDQTMREQSTMEPWMLDGRPHQVEGIRCRVSLLDAEAGIDFTGAEPGRELREQVDPEDVDQRELVDRFLDIVADYVDSDDHVHLHGMEQPDYEAEGIVSLPRNGPLQLREEVYWLPGWEEVVRGTIRIVPPAGISFQQQRNARPPFFSSSPSTIRELAGLTDIELEAVVSAREQWYTEGVLLEESLDPLLYGKLQRRFSFDESGVATIVVDAESPNGEIHRIMRITRDADFRRASVFSDRSKEAWALWERVVY
jgi:hypothetical protein